MCICACMCKHVCMYVYKCMYMYVCRWGIDKTKWTIYMQRNSIRVNNEGESNCMYLQVCGYIQKKHTSVTILMSMTITYSQMPWKKAYDPPPPSPKTTFLTQTQRRNGSTSTSLKLATVRRTVGQGNLFTIAYDDSWIKLREIRSSVYIYKRIYLIQQSSVLDTPSYTFKLASAHLKPIFKGVYYFSSSS